jgi:hypothetical protein
MSDDHRVSNHTAALLAGTIYGVLLDAHFFHGSFISLACGTVVGALVLTPVVLILPDASAVAANPNPSAPANRTYGNRAPLNASKSEACKTNSQMNSLPHHFQKSGHRRLCLCRIAFSSVSNTSSNSGAAAIRLAFASATASGISSGNSTRKALPPARVRASMIHS